MKLENLDKLVKMLILHEGMILNGYKCPAGKWTVGVGHNLEANPLTRNQENWLLDYEAVEYCSRGRIKSITKEGALYLLGYDIGNCIMHLDPLKVYQELDEVRRCVLVDMVFNLGIVGVLKFKNTLKAIEKGDYAAAHLGMLNSLWAKQVGKAPGQRAHRLAGMMLTGVWYNAPTIIPFVSPSRSFPPHTSPPLPMPGK
jgi:lysozyme